MKITILALAALVSVAMAAPGTTSSHPPTNPHPTTTVHGVPTAPAEPTSTVTPDTSSGFDGKSKCIISAYRPPSWARITTCCRSNRGTPTLDVKDGREYCKLPIEREGYMRRCIMGLHYNTIVNCTY